jgi:8-oxo-dGTP diphosphatase
MTNNKNPWGMAVKAVIFDDQGRCLMVRRSKHNQSFVGLWEWPGGKVDPGEDFATAIRREVAEETGLVVEITGLVDAIDLKLPKVNVILLCMETRLVISGKVELSEEHDAFAWVSPADMSRYDYLPSHAAMMLEYAGRKLAGCRTPGTTDSMENHHG